MCTKAGPVRRVIAVVFARGGSKGLPGKNLATIGGVPLVGLAVDVARSCPSIERVFASTDDELIAEVAVRHGAEAPFRRPAELAADSSPEWLAWRHAIDEIEARGQPVDVLVSVPPTAPLRRPADVEMCIAALAPGIDAVITVTPSSQNPWFTTVRLEDGLVLPLLEDGPTYHRRQDAPATYEITPVAYVARSEHVRSASSLLAGRIAAVVVPPERAIDIDTALDLQIARCLRAEASSEP